MYNIECINIFLLHILAIVLDHYYLFILFKTHTYQTFNKYERTEYIDDIQRSTMDNTCWLDSCSFRP